MVHYSVHQQLMKHLASGILALLLSLNAVFGVLGQGVLCLHGGFDAHFEAGAQQNWSCQFSGTVETALTDRQDDCPPCIDLIIRSSDTESIRAADRVIPAAPLLDVASVTVTEVEFLPLKSRIVSLASPRAPPHVEPSSLLVARTQVLLV